MSKNIIEKGMVLLDKCTTVSLAVIDDNGYPRIYAMEKVLSDALDKVVVITKGNSNKVKFLKLNNKCSIEVHNENDMVSLRGLIEIIEEYNKIKTILPDEYLKRLESSGADKYCVLVFEAVKHNLYIDNKFEEF